LELARGLGVAAQPLQQVAAHGREQVVSVEPGVLAEVLHDVEHGLRGTARSSSTMGEGMSWARPS
jgi:hypothetical protein